MANSSDGRGQVKNPETDGRLKQNAGGSSGGQGQAKGGKSSGGKKGR